MRKQEFTTSLVLPMLSRKRYESKRDSNFDRLLLNNFSGHIPGVYFLSEFAEI